MRPLIVVLALCACAQSGCAAAPPPPPTPPQVPAGPSLSDGATKIVAALRLRPDVGRICGGSEHDFRDAMRETVITLVMSGEIGGNPRKDAYSAADFFQAHCTRSEAAPAVARSASAVSP